MEILYIVILGLVLFGVPELLRPKKQKYEYPEIPDPEQAMHRPPAQVLKGKVKYAPEDTEEGKSLEWADAGVTMPPPVTVSAYEPEANPWRGKLNLSHIVNGVMFAEIIQPPRAKRPFSRR